MRLVTALLLFTLVGCATATDIEGQDRGMFLPTGRVFVDFRKQKEGDEDAPRSRAFGIEASVSGGRGEFDITLAGGDTIFSGGGSISGPATVNTDVTMFEAHVAARGGWRIKDRLNIHGIAGLGWHRTKVELTSGATRLEEDIDNLGPIIGVRVGFEATEWLEIYGRATVLFLDGFGISESQQAEVGAQITLNEAVALFAAYRWWRFQQEDFSITTDIDFRGGGFVVGIVIRF